MNANYISSPVTPTKQQIFIYSKFNSTALLGSLLLLLSYIYQIGLLLLLALILSSISIICQRSNIKIKAGPCIYRSLQISLFQGYNLVGQVCHDLFVGLPLFTEWMSQMFWFFCVANGVSFCVVFRGKAPKREHKRQNRSPKISRFQSLLEYNTKPIYGSQVAFLILICYILYIKYHTALICTIHIAA